MLIKRMFEGCGIGFAVVRLFGSKSFGTGSEFNCVSVFGIGFRAPPDFGWESFWNVVGPGAGAE